MIKVTFCAYDKPDSLGGPLTWLVQLLPALREYGIESQCLFLTHWGETGPYLEKLRADGFDCKQIACHDHTHDRVQWILSQLQQNPPDIFVPNLVIASYFAGHWVRKANIPTVGILHSDDPFYRGIQEEFVLGREEYRVSALVCVSRELEKQVIAKNPESTSTHRISYGVNIPPQRVKRVSGCLRLVYVGRLAEEQKRISDVTQAMCQAVANIPGTEAIIYGDGPDRDNVEAILLKEAAGLPVKLAGRVNSDQMQSKLLDNDVLVLLSDYEGLPIAVLESMACGVVPVCLKMRSGIPELVENNVTGLVVDDRESSFFDAIRRLQNEPGLWERLSQAAKHKVEREYSKDVCVEHWANLFTQLHSKISNKSTISIPHKIKLPPTHSALASADPRPSKPSMPYQWYRRSRIFLGRIRRLGSLIK